MEDEKAKIRTNHSKKLCIAFLVLGLIAIALCWIPVVGIVASILALVISIVLNIKRIKNKGKGNKFIIVGIVCCILGIVISLVSTSLFFHYFKSNSAGTVASLMSDADKEDYNSMINKYIGDSKSGSEVHEMIQEIVTQNNQYIDQSGKFICIDASNITDANEGWNNIGMNADAFQGGENNYVNVSDSSRMMKEVSSKISSRKDYIVTVSTDPEGCTDDIIHIVKIVEK